MIVWPCVSTSHGLSLLHCSKYVHSKGTSLQWFSQTPTVSVPVVPSLYSDTLFSCWLFLQETLGKLSPVAYVDILEGDAEGFVRFHSPEEAKAVSDARAELQKEHSWKLEILSGEALLLCCLFPKIICRYFTDPSWNVGRVSMSWVIKFPDDQNEKII